MTTNLRSIFRVSNEPANDASYKDKFNAPAQDKRLDQVEFENSENFTRVTGNADFSQGLVGQLNIATEPANNTQFNQRSGGYNP